MKKIQLIAALCVLSSAYAAYSKDYSKESKAMEGKSGKMTSETGIFVTGKDLTWQDAGPELPAGAKVAVLEGDPSKDGMFTLRLKLPANYKVQAHTHPADDRLTVIEGTFYIGVGDKFDEKAARELKAGGFLMLEPNVQHYGFTKSGGAVLQISAKGPWGMEYVNKSEDPRTQKTHKH